MLSTTLAYLSTILFNEKQHGVIDVAFELQVLSILHWSFLTLWGIQSESCIAKPNERAGQHHNAVGGKILKCFCNKPSFIKCNRHFTVSYSHHRECNEKENVTRLIIAHDKMFNRKGRMLYYQCKSAIMAWLLHFHDNPMPLSSRYPEFPCSQYLVSCVCVCAGSRVCVWCVLGGAFLFCFYLIKRTCFKAVLASQRN